MLPKDKKWLPISESRLLRDISPPKRPLFDYRLAVCDVCCKIRLTVISVLHIITDTEDGAIYYLFQDLVQQLAHY